MAVMRITGDGEERVRIEMELPWVRRREAGQSRILVRLSARVFETLQCHYYSMPLSVTLNPEATVRLAHSSDARAVSWIFFRCLSYFVPEHWLQFAWFPPAKVTQDSGRVGECGVSLRGREAKR